MHHVSTVAHILNTSICTPARIVSPPPPPSPFDQLTSALAAHQELLFRVPEAYARLVPQESRFVRCYAPSVDACALCLEAQYHAWTQGR